MSATLAVSGSNLCGDAPFSVALCVGGEVLVSSVPAGARGDLAVLCRDVCASRSVSPAELDRVVVDLGPGSYTGLRVAVTFVRLLAQFSSLKVEGVCSLAALSRHAAVGDGVRSRPLLDARRGRWHTALHEHVGEVTRELEPARAAAASDVLARVAPDEVLVAPVGLAAQLEADHGLRCTAATGWSAAALLADGLPRFEAELHELEPRYLMASYAED